MATVTLTKLKFLLLAQDKPAYQVGAFCGIDPNTIGEYARGEKAMSQKHLHALCDYFDCEPFDLAGTIDVEIPDPVAAEG